jgi:hypothetical protein
MPRNRGVRAAEKLFANNGCPFAVQRKTQDYLCRGNFVSWMGWILPAAERAADISFPV